MSGPEAGGDVAFFLAYRSAERQAAGEQALGEPQGQTRPGSSHRRQAFRKNLTRARRIVTEKLSYSQLQADIVDSPRQISEGACIAAVDPRGLYVAQWAGDTGLGRGDVERDRSGSLIDVLRLQG